MFPASNFQISIFVTPSAWAPLTDEIAYCSSRTGNALTIVRAQESTSDLKHLVGAYVEMRPTAEHFSAIHTAVNAIENAGYIPVDVTGLADDDIIRYNSATGNWESCSEPFAFSQITLTPRSSYVSNVEGGMYYDSDDNGVYVGTE